VVERVEAHPSLKARVGEWYYAAIAVRTFNRQYLFRSPRLEAELGDELVRGVTVLVQNAAPYTYFGNVPVEMGEGAALDSGDLAGVVLKRASPLDLPPVAWRALSKRSHVNRYRQIHAFSGLRGLQVRSVDDHPFPVQVDGDFIGEVDEASFTVIPGGLLVAA
jgi:diacylglycerol kinase family enzyme